ncbi:right-handed parallel beta-helix repeat-containing protein [Actinomadura sp. LD22]|uniref:Right-handed parallel beta-helix repeat-containing protein n=1 Tax=Actinomadura physcomitrii TaxID=2650748 RepID=A0A6I4M1H6_9ACTN|nr:right-handed parallel beta-helix repeat-containing protein [Actinomadura physcomitrii]MVZ99151.1 right-handed parallel beta-helix repeat-containing protein [Actinomadura physcomitrii]
MTHPNHRPRLPGAGGRGLAAVAAALGLGLVPLGILPGTPAPRAHADPVADANRQAALVDQEDQRIMQTRSVLSAILMIGGAATTQWKRPQIFGSAQGKTLVLPPTTNGRPYTVADLAKFGGQYFRRQSDGSYLLGIHVFVADGAKLLLASGTSPLVLRMGSLPGAFSSIVSFGGTIQIKGTQRSPVQITSWNPRANAPDRQVADGRAYIRAVGGEFKMDYTKVSDLGFWSGRTGGIALTGTDRPSSATKHLNKEQRHAAKKKRQEQQQNGGNTGGGPGDIETEAPGGTATHVPAADLVTGSITNSTVTGDAFGLFVSGSNQTQITNDEILNSLVNGLVMHRFAKNANIANTTVRGSKGDGFVLSRATEKIRVTNCTAEKNGHNGFTLNGQALADGPSASGESLESFGDSSINNSLAKDNGHYGIELLGGDKLSVQNSKVIGGDMGIVVRDAATNVQISGNQLTGQVRQGISLRDGVKDANLAGNTVDGARTGIYMRGSSATLLGNTIKGAKAHGISLVGSAGGSEIRDNTLSGSGTSAVSTSRSHGKVVKEDNNDDGWHDTASLWMKIQRYLTPLNVIWACVFAVVIFSMIRARNDRQRIGRLGLHPYTLQQPLEKRQVWSLPRRSAQPQPRPMPARPGPVPGPMPGAPAMAGAGAGGRGGTPLAAPTGEPVAGRHVAPPPGGPSASPTVPGNVRRPAVPHGPQPVAPHSSQTTGPRPVPPPATPPHPTPRGGVPQPQRGV